MSPLYRVFPADPEAGPGMPGGALFVHRALQGGGRHDNPDVYGALYVTRDPASAVAERLRRLGTKPLTEQRFALAGGRTLALAEIDDEALGAMPDLDDAAELLSRQLRPSAVATRERERTQRIALDVYQEGVAGFGWWSAIEASWSNVTLFAERVGSRLALLGPPEPLTLEHPAVRVAAEALELRSSGQSAPRK